MVVSWWIVAFCALFTLHIVVVLRFQVLSDRVERHGETLDELTEKTNAENEHLHAEAQLANDRFVNLTNGMIKRIRRLEQNVEELYADQGTILQKIDDLNHNVNRLTKGYRRLNQRLLHMENITEYHTFKGYISAGRVESAARKIDTDEQSNHIDASSTDYGGSKADDLSRLGKKYKKLSKQLEDTTQKLYRLSNYVSDYSTALQIIESGQDVGMRNDEYLADNQRAMRIKLTEMETRLQDVYLHYREDMRRHGGILPEEVAPTFEYDQVYSSSTTGGPTSFTPADQASPRVSSVPTTPVPQRVTPYRPGDTSLKVTQYFVTPPPSSVRWSNAHKTRDVSSGSGSDVRYTPDPRISKRTTQHVEEYNGVESTVARPPDIGDAAPSTSTGHTSTEGPSKHIGEKEELGN